MPVYVKTSGENTTTGWNELTSIEGSSSEDIYVRVNSGNGSINRRVESVSVRTNTGWVPVHTAYVTPPPVQPSAPTLSRASGWNTRIDQTKVSWDSTTNTTSYQLTVYDDNLNFIEDRFYSPPTTSATLELTPNGPPRLYQIRSINTNSGGQTATSNGSNYIRVVPGKTNQPFTVSHQYQTWFFSQSSTTVNCNVGATWSITKTGSSSDQNIAGYVNVERVQYGLEYYGYQVFSISGNSRTLGFSSPGYAFNYSTTALVPKYEDFAVSGLGGGTYSLTATGSNWSSRDPGCVLRTFNGAQTSIKGTYFRITGTETTANTT